MKNKGKRLLGRIKSGAPLNSNGKSGYGNKNKPSLCNANASRPPPVKGKLNMRKRRPGSNFMSQRMLKNRTCPAM
jgi:hypothetical protein